MPRSAVSAPRLNRVDPFGDLHAVAERGMFTGNRGCLVDDTGRIVRHHRGQLWITCLTSYRGWKSPLDEPGRWTPLFFLDEAVALAAGHRPCGLCRRDDYRSYRDAVQSGLGMDRPPSATDLNRMLAAERLRRGRGLRRADDRKTWTANVSELPDGTVIVDDGLLPLLISGPNLLSFGFGGWRPSGVRSERGMATVLTPPTSVTALAHGFAPKLHPSAERPQVGDARREPLQPSAVAWSSSEETETSSNSTWGRKERST